MNNSENISELLNERVKELNCLYEISKICQNYAQPFNDTLNKIIATIPQGWQYSKNLNVYLVFDGEIFGNKPNETPNNVTSSDIFIAQKNRGEIVVYYENQTYSFLKEEQPLLDKIGIEIATFIDRFEQRAKEELVAEKMRYNDRLSVLGELTASIAHELNTPLGNVLGYAELLKKSEIDPVKKGDIQKNVSHNGWMMGFEPTTPGTTNQCSNQLSYNHHILVCKYR